jgi:arsenite methyltransferase
LRWAIPIEEYRVGLIEAGFAHVEVIDSGSDLNTYAKVGNQAACCPPPAPSPSGLAVVDARRQVRGPGQGPER